MNYKIQHIPINKTKRPGKKIKVEYITIHSTANERSTAQNERSWLVNPSNKRIASWHIAIDEREAIEVIPLDEIAYHAGNKEGNNKSIGIEICESGDREKTIRNAVKLVAKMLQEEGWGVDRLKRHFDWSGKNCPRIFNYNDWEGWAKFKRDVFLELTCQNLSPWARDAWDWGIKNGITDGKRPRDMATREEIMTMIFRAKGVK